MKDKKTLDKYWDNFNYELYYKFIKIKYNYE